MSAFGSRLGNSFAYRFNKAAAMFRRPFMIDLAGTTFQVPLMGQLGEPNIQLAENWFTQLLKRLKLPAGSGFLDVGANVGQTLLMFRSCYDNPYWGFEPNAICVYYLEELIRVNALRNVQIIPSGLGDRPMLAKFFLKHSSDTGATIVNDFRPEFYAADEVKYVPVFRLDDLDLPLHDTALIKIDVEGAELDVVSGMRQLIADQLPAVICEVLDYHSEDSAKMLQERASGLFGLFRELGYSAFRIRHEGARLDLEPIGSLELKRFSQGSYDLNDYLFLPAGRTIEGIG